MTAHEIVERILEGRNRVPGETSATAHAPVNIALCKYWGKRDEVLNLPVTSSLSISLGHKGTDATLSIQGQQDEIIINEEVLDSTSKGAIRMSAFLDLFRPTPGTFFKLSTQTNVPVAAGLASSAAAFAAVVKSLDRLFDWSLDDSALSILARLGSGSACRSVYEGFVEWHAGEAADGMDSYATLLKEQWPALRIGLLTLSSATKPIGSREAMKRTRETCTLYASWPEQVRRDLGLLKEALRDKNFEQLGETAENNALTMHATMIATWPPVLYWLPASVQAMHQVWALREEGLPVYFTMDAGPNLKLLFEEHHRETITSAFEGVEIVDPFRD